MKLKTHSGNVITITISDRTWTFAETIFYCKSNKREVIIKPQMLVDLKQNILEEKNLLKDMLKEEQDEEEIQSNLKLLCRVEDIIKADRYSGKYIEEKEEDYED